MTLPLGTTHPRTPAYIYSCWQTAERALIAEIQSLQQGLALGIPIAEFEDQVKADAEHDACFAMLAATEGWMTVDFERRRNGLTNDTTMESAFQAIYASAVNAGRKVSIRDICREWRVHARLANKLDIATLLDEYLGLIDFRHWIAHGRCNLGTPLPGIVEILSVYAVATELPKLMRQWRPGLKQSLDFRWP